MNSTNSLSLSIVIPTYNREQILIDTINYLMLFFTQKREREREKRAWIFSPFSILWDKKTFISFLKSLRKHLKNENYDINFAIIFIAERTYYNIDENNKIYQCAILARNKLYSSRKYWMDLMELKINRKVDNQVKKYNQGSILLN